MTERKTIFSLDRKYRYTLWREWDDLFEETGSRKGKYLMVIGLNPSTADETKDDPTIRRCIDFAKRWGFGALCMTNLFAWRDTSPEAMKRVPHPEGVANLGYLEEISETSGMILSAWGKHGSHRGQDAIVRKRLIGFPIHYLKLNKDGSPMHPLYVPADTIPTQWPL